VYHLRRGYSRVVVLVDVLTPDPTASERDPDDGEDLPGGGTSRFR